jgi:S1-C subfamily serine protease
VSCPKCGFNSCKCGKNRKKYLSAVQSRNKASLLLKIVVLIFMVIGISGTASAAPFTENSSSPSLHAGIVQNGTVFIEEGYSGIVAVKDPLLKKTVKLKVDYQPSRSGSGFFVTKNGYIITAFHVVSDPESSTLKKVNNEAVKRYVEKTALTFYIENINPQIGQKLLPESSQSHPNLDKNKNYITNLFIKKGWISTKSYKYSIYVKGPALNGINAEKSLEARLVDVGNSTSDKDIALLKVDPEGKNMPALNISLNNPKIGERIYIYGYSGSTMERQQNTSSNNANQSSVTRSANYNPSASSGRVTAKTSNSKGIVYYKTNATASEGCSGGPVVNSQNNVEGVLVYGIQEGNTSKNEKRVGTLFLSPKYIKEIGNKNKVPLNVV